MDPLTVKEHMTLQLEGRTYKHAGAKTTDAHWLFSETPTRYTQRLLALIDTPQALAAYPATVRRLIRLRDARRAVRNRRDVAC